VTGSNQYLKAGLRSICKNELNEVLLARSRTIVPFAAVTHELPSSSSELPSSSASTALPRR
jgi:hypothetical protein